MKKMQKPTIEILILPDGQIKITVKGITGSRCLSMTEFLEEGLGDLVERELKEEYFQEENKDFIYLREE